MEYKVHQLEYSLNREVTSTALLAIGIVALFWMTLGLEWVGVHAPILRSVAGTLLLLFVPGALLTRALGIERESAGIFVLFSVGLSFTVLGLLTPLTSLVLSPLGVDAPLSLLPLSVVLTVVIAVLVALVRFIADEVPPMQVGLRGSFQVVLLLFLLPTVAAVAAILMDRFQVTAGMFLLVIAIESVVLLAATRALPENLYPFTVFFVSVSLLLHRNLLTDHVVGADIQETYSLAGLILQSQYWSPDLSGSLMALPMVTSVPAAFTTVTGIELATVFTVIYVFLFSLVPVTLFYLYTELFDENVALFGSLFFAFYHVSFYFTPGKQLVSELFVALLLLLFFRYGIERAAHAFVAVLLAAGVVLSHYGMTYVFGLSLLAVAVGLPVVRRFIGETNHSLSITYPVALLVGASAWYAYASRELIEALSAIPLSVAGQLALLISGTPFVAEGTGASTVQQQTTVVEEINLYIYLLLTALVAVGVGWKVLVTFAQIQRGEGPEHVEFTALAIPFFGFLAASNIIVLNLWVDRVYQMVLIVLAPFLALGFSFVARTVNEILGRFSMRNGADVQWLPLAVLLGTLLAFNTGIVAAVAGTPTPHTFDSEAQDYAYSSAELDGGEWIKQYGAIKPVDANQTVDSNDTVTIYTDTHSFQMFRSILPRRHYNAEVILLKSRWNPQFDRARIGDGYVFIRNRSVAGEDVRISRLSRANASSISRSGDVIYDNGDVVIVKVESGGERNGSASEHLSRTVPSQHPYHDTHAAVTTEYDVR